MQESKGFYYPSEYGYEKVLAVKYMALLARNNLISHSILYFNNFDDSVDVTSVQWQKKTHNSIKIIYKSKHLPKYWDFSSPKPLLFQAIKTVILKES